MEYVTQGNATIATLIVIWILGGQMFSDMVAAKRREELGFFNKMYFTFAWPFIVLAVCIRT